MTSTETDSNASERLDERTQPPNSYEGFEYLDEDFGDAPVEDLGGPEDATETEAEAFDLKKALDEAEVDKAKQAQDFRGKFFYWAMWLITAALVINFVVMGFYMASQWRDISDPVMVSWFSATIVEVLGLGYIIATYLFNSPKSVTPRPRGDGAGSSDQE